VSRQSNPPAHSLLSAYLATGDELTWEQAAQQLGRILQVGLCPDDREFDRFLPYEMQLVSYQHWSGLAVAQRAATWFSELGLGTVADLGSGAGKFCVAAALFGGCRFTGLEQRPRLVTAARNLAQLFQVDDRVRFIAGAVGEAATPRADAYYLYNPFGENLYPPSAQLDNEVELSQARYDRDVAAVEDLLRGVPLGTYVVTYNSFGGRMPSGYDAVRVARDLPAVLRMWRKTREPRKPRGPVPAPKA
jgi:predicted RNA methylase